MPGAGADVRSMTGYSSSSLQIRKHFQNGWRVQLHTQGTERCLIWHGRASVRCMLWGKLCELDTKVHMLGSSAISNEGKGEDGCKGAPESATGQVQ